MIPLQLSWALDNDTLVLTVNRMRYVGHALALVLAVCIPTDVDGQENATARIRKIAGCYALTLGRWSRPLRSEEGGPTVQTPPSSFRLDTVPVQKTGQVPRFAVEPVQLVAGRMPASWALSPNDSINLFWSTGFVGVRLRLAVHGDSLLGVATAFHDAHAFGEPPDPSAAVVATRTVCSSG